MAILKEIGEIHSWMSALGGDFHKITKVSSLPDPIFQCDGRSMVSFSSNNYLALAHDPRIIAAAKIGLEKYGVANCESRLLGGDMDIYLDLEAKIAALKSKEQSMIFATGYLTNLGVLSAIPNTGMLARVYGFRSGKRYKYAYFSDESNHTSIRQGIDMSGAQKVTYRHCDMEDLSNKLKSSNANCKIIVSDGVFSMDGDIVPLPDMLSIAEKYDAMIYIDDAHGTGVLGPNGKGTTEYFDIHSPRIISMGTLSKAYGAIGGFIATESYITDLLRLSCSAYGFTSTLPPDQVYAVSMAIDIAHNEPHRRERLWNNQKYFIAKIEALGLDILSRQTCIVPVVIGNEERCENIAHTLAEKGFHVDSIIFPAVKRGQARLRFNMNAHHTHEQIDELVAVLAEQQKLGQLDIPQTLAVAC